MTAKIDDAVSRAVLFDWELRTDHWELLFKIP